MSNKPNGSVRERRHTETADIDRLATQDMLALINREDQAVTSATGACLPEIARLVDNASATLNRGGRVVIVGAGASGRAALQMVADFAPDAHPQLIGLMAGGTEAKRQDQEKAAANYALGVADLQAIRFGHQDMLVALSVSGKTPWMWGALRHAWSVGACIALLSHSRESEAAQMADIVIVPETGAEVIVGFNEPKAHLAQQQILNMLASGLAIRTGRVYSNLRVDLKPDNTHWIERQIALVMAATQCNREQAKSALASSENDCRTAILMQLTGLNNEKAQDLLAENHQSLRVALQEAKPHLAEA
ncbi:MAG: N-acetylmuramic acid 6-phosphate etherase [Proteobacteria bacterium]|nr:N-acetylmuramic acid 6-phosphate etherase [Pseudomonadota bacterium]